MRCPRVQVPHTIVAARQHFLKVVTKGNIFGAVTDDDVNYWRVYVRLVLLPDLDNSLFSVTAAMQKEVSTMFHPTNPG